MSYIAVALEKTYPQTYIQNTTAPTFGGVTSVTPNNDGTVTANWSPATGSAATPVRYKVYIASGASVPPATLFTIANNTIDTPSTFVKADILKLGDQSTYLVNGQTYTIGVRAFSSENISETNIVTMNVTAIASGNIGGLFQADHTNFQSDHAAFQSDHTNFQTDHTNFGTDHTNFQGDHADFVSDLNTLSAYLTTLNGYLSTLSSDLDTLGSLNTSIATSASSLATSATSLASSATSIANTETALAADVAQLGTDLTTFASQLSELATDLTALEATSATLATNTAAIAAAATKVNNAANLILATVI